MRTLIKAPSECSSRERAEFVKLVNSGGEVVPGLSDRVLKIGYKLIFQYSADDQLIAVAALKRPNLAYRSRVFRKAGSEEKPDDYPLEFGWMVVAREAQGRGLSRVLGEAAIGGASGKSIYATTHESNNRMRRTNVHLGFRISGKPFPDNDGSGTLLLFIRPSP